MRLESWELRLDLGFGAGMLSFVVEVGTLGLECWDLGLECWDWNVRIGIEAGKFGLGLDLGLDWGFRAGMLGFGAGKL